MCLQKRGITKQHLRRTKEAEEQWDQWACEIREGKRQSFFKMLEERGLVNSVVGWVSFFLFPFFDSFVETSFRNLRSPDELVVTPGFQPILI